MSILFFNPNPHVEIGYRVLSLHSWGVYKNLIFAYMEVGEKIIAPELFPFTTSMWFGREQDTGASPIVKVGIVCECPEKRGATLCQLSKCGLGF